MAKQILFLLVASFLVQLITKSNGAPYDNQEPEIIDLVLRDQREEIGKGVHKEILSSGNGLKTGATIARPFNPELYVDEEALQGQILKDQILHYVTEGLASLTAHDPRPRYLEERKHRGQKKTSTPAPEMVESPDSIVVEAAIDYVESPLERALKKHPYPVKGHKCTTSAPETAELAEEEALEEVIQGTLDYAVRN